MSRAHPTIAAIIDPRKPAGGWFAPHVLLALALALLIAFALGFFAGSSGRFTPGYYAHRYQAPLTVPTTRERVSPPSHAAALPSLGSIHLDFFKTAINDQGLLGSCQSWAFTKQLSYAFNWNTQPNGLHYHRFYSPRFPYDVVSNGQDAGSYLEQYPPVVDSRGIPRWIEFPYGSVALTDGFQSYAVDYPIPPVVSQAAAAHHLGVSEQPLFQYPGAGQGGIDLIRQALATHHAVNLDFPVYPEYDQANADGSTVVPPQAGESSRGGHANTGVKYDDTHHNPDGTTGAVLASNQWGPQAGVGADGIRHSGNGNGYVWMSYSFIRQYVFGAAVIHVATSSPGVKPKPGAADGGGRPHAPFEKAKPPTTTPRPGAPTSWYVRPFSTRDTGKNIAPLINAAGDRTGIWPVYILAVVFAESGGNQYSARWGIWPDVSFGLMQVTTSTLTGYYSGCGFDSYCAQRYLNDAGTSINLGADILRDYKARTGVGYPGLWQCYNAGPGSCQSPYYAGFLQNYYVALTYATNAPGPLPPPPPPKPKPAHKLFPGHRWCRYARSHHRHCPTHRWHKRDTDIAKSWRYFLDHAAGGAVTRERWSPKLGMEREVFAHRIAYSWPKYPRIVKWVNRPRRKHS